MQINSQVLMKERLSTIINPVVRSANQGFSNYLFINSSFAMRTAKSVTETMKIVTARDIHAALIRRGFSCRSWALEYGFTPRTVQKCIHNHAPEHKKILRGKQYSKILCELSKTLDVDLIGEGNET